MATSGVQVTGLNAMVRDLQALGLEVDDLKAAFSSIADEAAQRMAQNAPRRTGRLAGDARGNLAKSKAVVTIGRASLPYAGPINYGWPARNIAAAGFLETTDQQMQPVAIARLEAEIDNQIRRKGLT